MLSRFLSQYSSRAQVWVGVLCGFVLAGVFVLGLFLSLLFMHAPEQSMADLRGPLVYANALSKNDHVYGNPEAPILFIEYSDTECPFCKQFHATLHELVDFYDGEVAWVYRHFPIESLHRKAWREAEATECIADLAGGDMFWTYLDRLYEVTPSNDGLADSQLFALAQEVGVREQNLASCLSGGQMTARVQAQYDAAVAAGAQGTPFGLIVAGDSIVPVAGALSFEQLQSMIDPLLSE